MDWLTMNWNVPGDVCLLCILLPEYDLEYRLCLC